MYQVMSSSADRAIELGGQIDDERYLSLSESLLSLIAQAFEFLTGEDEPKVVAVLAKCFPEWWLRTTVSGQALWDPNGAAERRLSDEFEPKDPEFLKEILESFPDEEGHCGGVCECDDALILFSVALEVLDNVRCDEQTRAAIHALISQLCNPHADRPRAEGGPLQIVISGWLLNALRSLTDGEALADLEAPATDEQMQHCLLSESQRRDLTETLDELLDSEQPSVIADAVRSLIV